MTPPLVRNIAFITLLSAAYYWLIVGVLAALSALLFPAYLPRSTAGLLVMQEVTHFTVLSVSALPIAAVLLRISKANAVALALWVGVAASLVLLVPFARYGNHALLTTSLDGALIVWGHIKIAGFPALLVWISLRLMPSNQPLHRDVFDGLAATSAPIDDGARLQPLNISGTMNEHDYFHAQWLHMKPRPWLAVVGAGILALFAWAIWYLFFGAKHHPAPWMSWVVGGSAVYLVTFFAVLLPYRMRRSFSQRKDLHREHIFEVSDSALAIRSEGSYWNKPWSDFLSWKEDKFVFLLYISDNAFHPIPKRYFPNDAAVESFRGTLRSKVIAK